MESWCFDSMDKGFVSTEIISTATFDCINRYKGAFMGGDFKPSLSYDHTGLFPSQQFVEYPCLPDMGIVEMMHDCASFGDFISPALVTLNGGARDYDYASFGGVISPCLVTSNRDSVDYDHASFGDVISPGLVTSNGGDVISPGLVTVNGCSTSRDDNFARFDNVVSPGLVTSNGGSGDDDYASFGDVSPGLVTSNGGSRDDDYASFGDDVSLGLFTSNAGSRDDNNASFGDVSNPGLVGYNGVSGDEESSSKVSSTVIDSYGQESSRIDLKLDGFGDKLYSYSTRTAHVLSSVESFTAPKRARATCLSSQIVYCQVYGCLKDLSSAKGYHKRHKVCDIHSKTSNVIVNGVEQRFCQQCSRFHLIGEFDDGKRSCRKRLAGHNERRRKPKVGFDCRNGASFRSYTGSNFQGLSPRSTSVGCRDMLQRGTSHVEKYRANDWVRQIMIENGTDCTQRPAIYNCINGQLHPKPTSPTHIRETIPFY